MERKGVTKDGLQGLEKGCEEGLATGYIGRIHLCHSLLRRPEAPTTELQAPSLQDLQELAGQLESKLRNR
ncbi:MAG: hypothetical protein DWH82_02990 [Planctomycetota bacterium]|nr:MAG: hypothetical protein DWH82_02990 [Planctomycetota bacterium]